MSDTRKEYVPPTAEIILLAPKEQLSALDWTFQGYAWKDDGYKVAGNGVASAVAVNGGFGLDDWAEDGFTFQQSTTK